MLNRIELPTGQNIEMHHTPDGRVVESYAGGKVKVYDGHSPKTTIDIPEFNVHIAIHKFGPFEFNKIDEIDDVLVRKGHHKSRFAAGFTDRENGGPYGYDVWSSEGIIGFASGKRLDLLIASLFYDDLGLTGAIKDTYMDNAVKRHLKFASITARTYIHQAQV